MKQKIAAACALLAFAVCLIAGLVAGNSFGATTGRALVAMAVTLVIGLVAGAMIEKTLQENLRPAGQKNSDSGTDSSESGR
jgi:outer membrane lipoprotein SlyB